MSVTVNLRNNTTFFIKVNGIDEVIVPNSEIEDKTIQWISTENKTIQIFDNEEANNTPICQGSLNFVTNDGIFVDRGNFTGAQFVKMQADITGTVNVILQEENGTGGKLLEWSEIDPETTVNLSFWNL
jgi:hypothetical protein